MAPFRPGTRGTSEGFLRFVCAKNPNNGRLEEEFPHVLRNLFDHFGLPLFRLTVFQEMRQERKAYYAGLRRTSPG